MAENTATPLWLDIKTEYIDENFEKVLQYLYQGAKRPASRDSFYVTTVRLLEKRIQELITQTVSVPLQENLTDSIDPSVACRMCGIYLLAYAEVESEFKLKAYSVMLLALAHIVQNNAQELTEIAVANQLGRIGGKYPFSWDDIVSFQPQILAHKICNHTVTTDAGMEDAWFEDKGTVRLSKGVLSIASISKDELLRGNLVPSLEVMDGTIHILSGKGDKVKKSDLDNLEKMSDFTRDFLRSLKDNGPKKSKHLKQYSNGDKIRVLITGKKDGNVTVRTIDKSYEQIEGYIKVNDSYLYYDSQDFFKYLPVGSTMDATLVNALKGTFDIRSEFIDYIVNYRANLGNYVYARIREISPDKKGNIKAYMWTVDGYPVQAYLNDDYREGDVVDVQIIDFGKERYKGVIMVEIAEKVNETVDEEESKKNCLYDFCYTYEEPQEIKEGELETDSLNILGRLLMEYQRNLPRPSDRYRMLCVAKILSEMTGCIENSRYINFVAGYMENLVFFAKGDYDRIGEISYDGEHLTDSVSRRMNIVKVLKAYGDDSRNTFLSEIIETSPDELIRKIAVLVQSCNRIDDVISKSMQNVIKREIVKCLAIETEGETDLEEENGVYLGIENDRQEFKTSFFFAPKDAREQNQRLTILRGICAFLNTSVGGTLYLGVDDLGYVKGIADDIRHMEKVAYGNYKGVDGYVRYITDEAKKVFDLGVLTHIRISPMYEGKVIAISVQPYEYNIVSVEGEAFIRINSESVRMNESVRRQIMSQRILSKREDAENVSSLLEAISGRRKVILHGYSSSSSGDVRDRTVEPFVFASGHTTVWCYDLEDKANKVFKLDRISNVEILPDRWEYESHHRQGKMDIFRMTGENAIRVKLSLDLMAKNILVEEYPDAVKDLIPTDDADRWILETEVYRMEGLGRFYLGLAAEIEIIDAPGLKEYAAAYCKDNIL